MDVWGKVDTRTKFLFLSNGQPVRSVYADLFGGIMEGGATYRVKSRGWLERAGKVLEVWLPGTGPSDGPVYRVNPRPKACMVNPGLLP